MNQETNNISRISLDNQNNEEWNKMIEAAYSANDAYDMKEYLKNNFKESKDKVSKEELAELRKKLTSANKSFGSYKGHVTRKANSFTDINSVPKEPLNIIRDEKTTIAMNELEKARKKFKEALNANSSKEIIDNLYSELIKARKKFYSQTRKSEQTNANKEYEEIENKIIALSKKIPKNLQGNIINKLKRNNLLSKRLRNTFPEKIEKTTDISIYKKSLQEIEEIRKTIHNRLFKERLEYTDLIINGIKNTLTDADSDKRKKIEKITDKAKKSINNLEKEKNKYQDIINNYNQLDALTEEYIKSKKEENEAKKKTPEFIDMIKKMYSEKIPPQNTENANSQDTAPPKKAPEEKKLEHPTKRHIIKKIRKSTKNMKARIISGIAILTASIVVIGIAGTTIKNKFKNKPIDSNPTIEYFDNEEPNTQPPIEYFDNKKPDTKDTESTETSDTIKIETPEEENKQAEATLGNNYLNEEISPVKEEQETKPKTAEAVVGNYYLNKNGLPNKKEIIETPEKENKQAEATLGNNYLNEEISPVKEEQETKPKTAEAVVGNYYLNKNGLPNKKEIIETSEEENKTAEATLENNYLNEEISLVKEEPQKLTGNGSNHKPEEINNTYTLHLDEQMPYEYIENESPTLWDKVTIEEGAPIYTNVYDAYLGTNPKTPTYNSSDERMIMGIGYWDEELEDIERIYVYNQDAQEKIEEHEKKGDEKVTALTVDGKEFYSNIPTSKEELEEIAEGWYNYEDIAKEKEYTLKR